MGKKFKRISSFALSTVMAAYSVPLAVFAEELKDEPMQDIYLDEVVLEDGILQSDVFYLATPAASISENGNGRYLLKLGRGGSADSSSSALIKIADLTAKYGDDYVIRVRDSSAEVDNPDDNESLMEMMKDSEFTQREYADNEELADALENDVEAKAAYDEAVAAAIDYISDKSGLSDKFEDYAEEAKEAANDINNDNNIVQPVSDGETITLDTSENGTVDEVQKARQMFLGVDGVSQRIESNMDQNSAMQDLQSIANVMTDVVVGASVQVDFEPGETQKYLEVIPKDNYDADGDRMFYVILGAPSGTTTNSAASSCAFTIVDDEESEKSVVSFSADSYVHIPGEETVTVTVERSGAINSVVSAVVKTTGEGNALAGRDYSEVDRALLFPFGVSKLTVDIPVRTEYFSGEGNFELELVPETACTVGTGNATVSFTGTYGQEQAEEEVTDSLALSAVSSVRFLASAPVSGAYGLEHIEMGSDIDIKSPDTQWNTPCSDYCGTNAYDTKYAGGWHTRWDEDAWFSSPTGNVGVGFKLTDDSMPIWIAGAKVAWGTTGNCAEKRVMLLSDGALSHYADGYYGNSTFDTYSLRTKDQFSKIDYVYPVWDDNLRYNHCLAPQRIEFENAAGCSECDWMVIHGVAPIYRPFQFTLKQNSSLTFLNADGEYRTGTDAMTSASIIGASSNILNKWLNGNLTVAQSINDVTRQFTYLSGLNIVNPDGTKFKIGSNSNSSDPKILYTLSKENLTSWYNSIGSEQFAKTLKANPYAQKTGTGTATYSFITLEPEFSYIDSNVKLRNPYSFPVTFKISGTEYTLGAYEEKDLSYHLGDTLYTTFTISGDAADTYKPNGLKFKYQEPATGNEKEPSISFDENGYAYINSDTADHRLINTNITVEPEIQEINNEILVKIKNSELGKFQPIGILAQTKNSNGQLVYKNKKDVPNDTEYTYFVFADTKQTFNGRLYSIMVFPKDENDICCWYDKTTLRWYEGNNLYFTAGNAPLRNTIELTLNEANSKTSMYGTLNYMNYNIMAKSSGNASSVPARGTIVSSPFAVSGLNDEGSFETEEFSYFYDSTPRYVRYAVTVNGKDIVKEMKLQSTGNKLDISSTFDNGVSPVTSEIFSNIKISGSYKYNPAFSVLDGSVLPILTNDQVDLKVSILPSEYRSSVVSRADDNKYFADIAGMCAAAEEYYAEKNEITPAYSDVIKVKNKIENEDGKISIRLYNEDGNILDIYIIDPVNGAGNDQQGGFVDVYDENSGKHSGEMIDADSIFNAYEIVNTETPVSARLVVYDKNNKFKFAYEPVDKKTYNKGECIFNMPVEFLVDDPENQTRLFTAAPGDKLYLRLTTDRGGDIGFTYSDVYTGFSFDESALNTTPVEQGIESPIKIEFAELPFLGSSSMNLDFPFVQVGYMRIEQGYRMYIGFSPVQIVDAIAGSNIADMAADDRHDYSEDISYSKILKNGISGAWKGVKQAYNNIFDAGKFWSQDSALSGGNLGSPQWKFDLTLGIYFDFFTPKVIEGDNTTEYDVDFVFGGIGGYVAVSMGFKTAYYFPLPVVLIPAYIGISIDGTIMGMFGAARDTSKPEITYSMSRGQSCDFTSDLDRFQAHVQGGATVQINLGVGLCGVAGIRASGNVDMAALYRPSDFYDDFGFAIDINVGINVDMFLFTVPLMFNVAGWKWGSFEQAENGNAAIDKNGNIVSADTFQLRENAKGDSVWKGSSRLLQYALTPSKTTELVSNSYDHPDSQLITMRNGTNVLAFIDSDAEKGKYQNTTLKLSVYKNGIWTKPTAICDDGTADFQPSIAETKDGRVLVAWVSTGSHNITEDTEMKDYLNSIEVYASFVDIADDGTVTPEKPVKLTSGSREKYYDCMPTVVCDMVTGDSIVYYVKSGRTEGDILELANPYTNDCVVCYMIYNSEADEEVKNGKTVTIPSGWLFSDFYNSEFKGDTESENYLITNFGGQRFLDSPTFEGPNGKEYYTIPDFTAIGYNGLAVYAYSIDKDSSNDTTADKEIMLQIYDFRTHETKHRIQITDDSTADSMPQLFRSRYSEQSTDDEYKHTKLFWYRDDRSIVYIDVTSLIRDGINSDGTLVTSDGTSKQLSYTDENGNIRSIYLYPHQVNTPVDDSHASNQMADFKVTEDSNGRLFVIWTESVSRKNGASSQEIFAASLYSAPDDSGEAVSSGWSKPYQLTDDGHYHDELAVAMTGNNLLVVHNRFDMELDLPNDGKFYDGVVADHDILKISNMSLAATVMEPCGAVEATDISVSYPSVFDSEIVNSSTSDIELPQCGKDVNVNVTVANNGLTTTKGYKLTLYAVNNGTDTKIGETEINTALTPNAEEEYTFSYTLPDNIDGLCFKAVTQELNKNGVYYSNTSEYTSEPMQQRADYSISNISAYQLNDGFHLAYTLTNNGNAPASDEDRFLVVLNGPVNMHFKYSRDERILSNEAVGELGIGESKEYDIIVDISESMLRDYGFITTNLSVRRSEEFSYDDGTSYTDWYYLSDYGYANFYLNIPIKIEVSDVSLEVGESIVPAVSMKYSELLGNNEVSYSVDDNTVAMIENGRIIGVGSGNTKLYTTHIKTGATVVSEISVKPGKKPDDYFADISEILKKAEEDHTQKKGTAQVNSNYVENDDGSLSIMLYDELDRILDVYTIDPKTGKGIVESGGCADLSADSKAKKYYADISELREWAEKDYSDKNNVTPAKSEAVENADGKVTITLMDDDNNVLDTYTIDPKTGKGTDEDGEKVDLPQTGITPYMAAMTAVTLTFAAALILLGMFIIMRSGVIRKKEDE
ncbi:MAG: hypothetical protein E7495_08695 [Ruminococcus flavefaciens]|nr:hypothetical protein [Ruminococcus flavefaciens]